MDAAVLALLRGIVPDTAAPHVVGAWGPASAHLSLATCKADKMLFLSRRRRVGRVLRPDRAEALDLPALWAQVDAMERACNEIRHSIDKRLELAPRLATRLDVPWRTIELLIDDLLLLLSGLVTVLALRLWIKRSADDERMRKRARDGVAASLASIQAFQQLYQRRFQLFLRTVLPADHVRTLLRLAHAPIDMSYWRMLPDASATTGLPPLPVGKGGTDEAPVASPSNTRWQAALAMIRISFPAMTAMVQLVRRLYQNAPAWYLPLPGVSLLTIAAGATYGFTATMLFGRALSSQSQAVASGRPTLSKLLLSALLSVMATSDVFLASLAEAPAMPGSLDAERALLRHPQSVFAKRVLRSVLLGCFIGYLVATALQRPRIYSRLPGHLLLEQRSSRAPLLAASLLLLGAVAYSTRRSVALQYSIYAWRGTHKLAILHELSKGLVLHRREFYERCETMPAAGVQGMAPPSSVMLGPSKL